MPELLAPAGSPEKLKFAFAYGADAAYAGVPFFSLRARENEFNWENLAEGVALARALKKKIYLTVNIFSRNTKLATFANDLDRIIALAPDALIMSDPGLIAMVRERSARLPIHLSVQANCTNWRSVRFWQSVGITRIILSRELRLTEIREIADHAPEVELEAFVHGSMCIAYSGRCLLSRYMSNRDANQGVCDNSCRYPMRLYERSSEFFVEDGRTPGKLYPIEEDEHGTYVLSAKDLKLIEYLQELRAAGVTSFKIEGRTKSIFYLAVVTRAYRIAIDALASGGALDPALNEELERITRRGYHAGFLVASDQTPSEEYTKALRGQDASGFLGLVIGRMSEDRVYQVEVRGRIQLDVELEAMSPRGLKTVRVLKIEGPSGRLLSEAHSGLKGVAVTFSEALEEFTLLRDQRAFARLLDD